MDWDNFTNKIMQYDLHSCIIHYKGETIFHYEKIPHASKMLLPINSCTKSITSALICIAMDQGLVPEPHTLAYHFFPSILSDTDERKKQITLEHLLTLTAGFAWSEFSGIKSFPHMTRSTHWCDYVLMQPMAAVPGTKMEYNSGVSQLLSAIIAQCTKQPINEFAEKTLFGPLQFSDYEWKTDPQGLHTGGYGLMLTAHDLLKFGLLYLNNGSWHQQQLISPTLITQSTSAYIPTTPPDRGSYGWHWWTDHISIHDEGQLVQLPFYYARGYGGQFVFIMPTLEAVVVFTREKNNKKLFPLHLFIDHAAPQLAKLAIHSGHI